MAANLSESLAARCADHNNLEEQVSLTIWPMPTCQEVEHPDAEPTNTGRRLSKDGKSSHSLNLADSVKNWPTPATRDYKGVSGKGRQKRKGNPADTLPNAIAQYPTVTANENASGTPAGNMQKMLGNDPRVRGETPEQWSKGALNPTWVEWLMGWPIGWTSMEPITALDWRDWSVDPADSDEVPRVATGIKHRVSRLKAIGNGQVPQVAALAWKILTEEIN